MIAHRARIAAIVVATAVVAIFGAGAATGAGATGKAAVCKTFSTSGLKPKWSVIGNVTCAKARASLLQMSSRITCLSTFVRYQLILICSFIGGFCLKADKTLTRPVDLSKI